MIKYIKCLVVNRLCDPKSKLGIGEWLKGAYFSGMHHREFIYHHALRSMDWLISRKDMIERQIADRFLSIFDDKVQVLFYDITSSYFTSERSIMKTLLMKFGGMDTVVIIVLTAGRLLLGL